MYTMLIVDDNPNDRSGITELIDWEEEFIEVVGTAINGEDGFHKAIALKPDLVLTDVSMPIQNGIEMTEMIKQELPDTQFIFMSCFDDVEYLQSAINLDVCAYVLKPIVIPELVKAVGKMRKLKEVDMKREKHEAELVALVEQSLPLLQEQFLKELFYSSAWDGNELAARMKYLKMDLECEQYCVFCVQIDNYGIHYTNESMDQRHLLIYRLQKCVQEAITNPHDSCFLASQGYDRIVGIKKYSKSDISGNLDDITECANHCMELANQRLGLHVTIGISGLSDNLNDVAEQYGRAEYAVKSKIYSSGNRIIFHSEVYEPDHQVHYNYKNMYDELRNVVMGCDEASKLKFMETYLSQEAKFTENYIKSISYTIVNILHTILVENGKRFGDIFEDDFTIWRNLSLIETFADIKQFIMNTIHSVCDCLNKYNGKRNSIVDDIKAVIDEKYAEIENVNQIVEKMFISASHANLVFKQVTGSTIFDWVTAKRMEIAKQMLLNPYVKIYEIPEKIGYKTGAHFRSVFKGYTGTTPKQYQEKYSR
ncbi:response regulator [Paenibacillus contaminans]|uniref:DNA-binding response regulator n=1 Tax=Paenibacillus contaminans TaxID=450362 RepID=A0A329MG29_9BACL|nr:response regulator [Paenibacillus contaminans]RAV18901.1 hypothetical protein DQG23_22355 [Paenibacillus contaminans]